MNPFDIVRVGRTAEEKEAASAHAKELADYRLLVVPTKKAPPVRRDRVYATPVPPGAATPRNTNLLTGEYKPSAAMRDAVSRARAEQPALKSLETKEKSCATEHTLNAPAAAGPTTP